MSKQKRNRRRGTKTKPERAVLSPRPLPRAVVAAVVVVAVIGAVTLLLRSQRGAPDDALRPATGSGAALDGVDDPSHDGWASGSALDGVDDLSHDGWASGSALDGVDDLSRDGWASEAFAARATRQLKVIGKLMVKSATPSAQNLVHLVTEDFACGALRPTQLEQVFRDNALTVWRQPDVPIAPGAMHRGATGLAAALSRLRRDLGDASVVRVHFKLFRVEEAEGSTETTAYYHASGRSDAGAVQQNATWVCHWRPGEGDEARRLVSIDVRDYEQVVASGARPLFADCTEAVLGNDAAYREQLRPGINHWLTSHRRSGGHRRNSAYRGLAVGDANGDGLEDVYVCQDTGLPNRLLVQQPDGTATDMAELAGVDFLENTTAALLVDLDGDGDQDLLVAVKYGVLILENDGSGRFAARAAKSLPVAPPTAMAAADYDRDGDLDLYICSYRTFPWSNKAAAVPLPYHDANNGGSNVLLRNEGGWRFQHATREVGLEENNQRWSFAAAWEDYDNDGDLDLYVANDYGRNNLYRNDDGHFSDVAAEAGVEDISAGMSVSWGDYNNDGLMDLYVSNMFSSAGNRVTYQRRFQQSAGGATRSHFQRHARGNSLFENAGDGTFRDVSVRTAVTMGRWAWGSHFFDINNDGWEDLIVTNGFVTQSNHDDL